MANSKLLNCAISRICNCFCDGEFVAHCPSSFCPEPPALSIIPCARQDFFYAKTTKTVPIFLQFHQVKGPEPPSGLALERCPLCALEGGQWSPRSWLTRHIPWTAWHWIRCKRDSKRHWASPGSEQEQPFVFVHSGSSTVCVGARKWLILSRWRPVRCCWSFCVWGEKVGFLYSQRAKDVPAGWGRSLPAPHGNRAGREWICYICGGSLVQLSSPVKESQEECVPWQLGICPCYIIRRDSYFIFFKFYPPPASYYA